MASNFQPIASDSVVAECPRANDCWIEIELVGEDDRPVPNTAYKIVLPTGKEHIGKTDANGRARVTGFPRGSCEISFTDLDSDCWQLIEVV